MLIKFHTLNLVTNMSLKHIYELLLLEKYAKDPQKYQTQMSLQFFFSTFQVKKKIFL